jgi:outer membrane receptor protein involved in Fe transport
MTPRAPRIAPRSPAPAPAAPSRRAARHLAHRAAKGAGLAPALLALAVGAAVQAADSADDGDAPVLEHIVVTATRIDTTLEDAARSIAVLDRMTIESMQPQSVAQTLLYEPNITVAGGPRAANQAVNIRGLSGNKVLQTIDGARQSFESGHRPGYFLDPELLASVEAVRGPVSSLWGSGALGGVVAQRTLRADDYLARGDNLGGFVKSGYNDNNGQSTTTAAVLGRATDTDWLLSAYYRDSDDIALGNGETLEGSANETQGCWQSCVSASATRTAWNSSTAVPGLTVPCPRTARQHSTAPATSSCAASRPRITAASTTATHPTAISSTYRCWRTRIASPWTSAASATAAPTARPWTRSASTSPIAAASVT